MPVCVLSTDNYFNDISALINKYGTFDNLRDNGYDVDAPSSFQLDVLKSDLEDLADGLDIKAPMYLLNGTGVSMPKAISVNSQKIIVVEGIATMYDKVKDIFDVKIYVETENELRKSRFISRAIEERNQSKENALKHWDYITSAGEKYVKPFKKEADLILVLDEGKIVGIGTHKELLKDCQVYLEIAQSQLSKEEIENAWA